ncbi:MAG TPA: peroxidase family protein, partial [Roseiflexaceae bacterium]|nr:peroxidase family protein [Roseiflexaceae bacterium]
MAKYCPHSIAPAARAATRRDEDGLFGRMFPDLAAAPFDQGRDLALAEPDGPMALDPHDEPACDNARIPAGWAFFGQILAHDMTRDRAPLQRQELLDGLRNYRRPRLDLECVYGDGPLGQPYLYDNDDGDKLLVAPNDRGELNDLPRNHQGIAIVGDQRNDTYLFIAHLHVALLKLHNRLVDDVRAAGVPPARVFETAQRLTRWHYQWIVAHEYVPLH